MLFMLTLAVNTNTCLKKELFGLLTSPFTKKFKKIDIYFGQMVKDSERSGLLDLTLCYQPGPIFIKVTYRELILNYIHTFSFIILELALFSF